MSRKKSSAKTSKRPLLAFLFLASAVSIATAALLILSPSENNWLFGLSQFKAILFLAVAAGAILFASVATAISRKSAWSTDFMKRVNYFFRSGENFAWTFGLVFFLCMVLIVALSTAIQMMENSAIVARVLPVLSWASLICLIGLITIAWLGSDHIWALSTWLSKFGTGFWVLGAYIFVFALIHLKLYLEHHTGPLILPDLVNSSEPIGDDVRKYLGFSASRFMGPNYTGPYPPFPLIFFYPLLFVDLRTAYELVLVTTFFCALFASFVLPALVARSKLNAPLIALVGGTGLFAYGLGWEMENGQFNLMAFTFSALAVYIFHFHKKQRWAAYILFSIGLQLKLWPGIFILMLIDNQTDWVANAKRLGLLLVINFAALFILGADTLFSFINTLSSTRFDYFWVGDHSIESFLHLLSLDSNWSPYTIAALRVALLAAVLAPLGWMTFRDLKEKRAGFSPSLFLACTLGALLLPAISNDYKLSLLPGPVIIFLSSFDFSSKKFRPGTFPILLVLLFSISYFLTTQPISARPMVLANSMPLLAIMLWVTLAIDLLQRNKRP